MSRPAVVAVCAVVLVVGFVVGRASMSGSHTTVTVPTTVTRPLVIPARYVEAATDGRDSGPLDLARVTSVRRGAEIDTTITARDAWPSSLLGRVHLAILYDTTGDGRPDYKDVVDLFDGAPRSWISSLGQGVYPADVSRPGKTAIRVGRDASLFFSLAGQAPLLATTPIRIAVVAGHDRVPDRGWIVVPPPATLPQARTQTLTGEAEKRTTTCAATHVTLATVQRDLAAIRAAAALPTKNKLVGNARISAATDRFLRDLALAPLSNIQRNRLIDRAAAASAGVCQQCFQAFEAARPIPSIRAGDNGC